MKCELIEITDSEDVSRGAYHFHELPTNGDRLRFNGTDYKVCGYIREFVSHDLEMGFELCHIVEIIKA